MEALVRQRGLRVVLGLACFVIVVAGFRAAAELIVPTLLALFLALLCVPPMRRLMHHGVPSGLAVAIVVTCAALLALMVPVVVGRSLSQLQSVMPVYQERLDYLVAEMLAWVRELGLEIEPGELTNIDGGAIIRLASDTASALVAMLSNLFLIVLIMVFMLLEAQSLPSKLRLAMNSPQADLAEFATAAERVHRYLAIKAWVSLATGVLAGAISAACGVDFPLVWGLIAFLFNFIPNIGSVIAAIPPILLALVEHGVLRASLVGLGYLAINMVIGNLIEPRLLGKRLGLSTLVIFLSMLFWGWVWGPMGMFLSVPLTVIVKILLEHTEDFRWLAVLLGRGGSDDAA